ncbi:lipocalin-like domain-containing protein [Bacteroidales bacterium OttesenSCG-928-A17]|nr:lipocalin-like domain-containing protein [Bacteroidales bacterium OttesenSCG-928-A17]
MRNLRLIFITIWALCAFSCVDNDIPNTNGMWQLKTIEDKEGIIHPVDTIYYSFQRQCVFSYTSLEKNELGHEKAWVRYGYVDFPNDKLMHIKMDQGNDEATLNSLPWKGMEVEYEILHLSSKKMTLGFEGETYSFIKF